MGGGWGWGLVFRRARTEALAARFPKEAATPPYSIPPHPSTVALLRSSRVCRHEFTDRWHFWRRAGRGRGGSGGAFVRREAPSRMRTQGVFPSAPMAHARTQRGVRSVRLRRGGSALMGFDGELW